jgi:polyhydroxyalkanoate synthase
MVARMTAPNPMPAPRRLAPRPLGLHLAIAAATWLNSPSALQAWSVASRSSRKPPPLDADPRLAEALASADPDALRAAVGREILARAAAFAEGIERYRRHAYGRVDPDWPVAWQEGTTRLLDCAPGSSAPPALVVPSLVNRGYVLDLMPGRSFVRALAAAGYKPLLVDWDRPGSEERGWDLDAYVAGRLRRCLAHVAAACGGPTILVGYCMGGLLAAPLAQLDPDRVRALVLLATPWDFHAERADLARALAAQARLWLPVLDAGGEMPVDLLQALFAGLDPLLVIRKFIAFAALEPGSEKARDFVALEDWLNDGVPLAAGVARDCMIGWYGENRTAAGAWRIGGETVRPQVIRAPALVVAPAQDRIVPPASALALGNALSRATIMTPPIGHIGMVGSSRAPATLWPRIFGWLGGIAAT